MGSTLRQREVAKQPLRRVLREVNRRIPNTDYFHIGELLECGHVVRIKTDWIGETTAERRRCRKCAQDLPPDWDATTTERSGVAN